ncbi:hypothetical protein [Rheinheimera fenheensis]|uniref:hypothetical protein n=1 Tax=Rheinheimera fenheensis TaxID=3152295 RepID=UPI00325C6659
MIFALLDYFKYKKRIGKYSDESLRNIGLKKASVSEFPNWKNIPFGEILFVHTANSSLSWVIMYFTNSVLSHTAIIYGNGIVHDTTTDGVLRHSLENYFYGESYIEFRTLPSNRTPEEMRAFLDSTLGHGYNWTGVFFLAFHIAIANTPDFSWRLFFDLLLIGFVILIIAKIIYLPAFNIFLAIGVFYCITVLINKTIRKRAIAEAFMPNIRS